MARETGWDEQTLLNMPVARLYQYYHCALQYGGVKVKWATDTTNKDKTRAERLKFLRGKSPNNDNHQTPQTH